MDAHKEALRVIAEQAKVVLRNYCYSGKWEDPKYLMFEVAAKDREKIVGKKFEGEEFVYTVAEESERVEQGVFEVIIYYLPNEKKRLDDDIAEGVKKYGVISPEGKFYECGYAGHNNLEYWLVQRGLLPDNQDDPLEWCGWVKLTGSAMTECEFVFDEEVDEFDFTTSKSTVLKTNELTDAQIDAMVSYIESLGREYVNFNYHWYTLENLKKLKGFPI